MLNHKAALINTLFFLLILSMSIFPADAGKNSDGINLVQNGSFEDNSNDAWLSNRLEPEITYSYDDDVAVHGNSSMRVIGRRASSAPNGARGGVRQFVQLSGDAPEAYRFRASYRTEGLSKPDSVRIRFMFNDATGTTIRGLSQDPVHRIISNNVNHTYGGTAHLHITAVELADHEWKEIDVTFVPPQHTTEINVGLFLWHDIGTIWWDNVSLERVRTEGGSDIPDVEWVDRRDALPSPYSDISGVLREFIDKGRRVTRINTVSSLRQAIAESKAGDVILLEDGEYEGVGPIMIENKHGSQSEPIVLAAENIGQAMITGTLQLIIKDSSYIVIEGLSFETSVFNNNRKQFAERRSNSAVVLLDAYQTRVTRNRFALQETYGGETRREWLSVDGSKGGYNRIDHNLFEGKIQVGNYIAINSDLGRPTGADTTPRHTRIDHNHFRDMASLGINGMEAVVLGMATYRDMAHIDAQSVFEYNLLERVDGERSEIISIKDSGNIVRYNTIVESAGSIVARYGHRNSIYGNYIIGNNKSGTGGVRVYGADQKVFNNYFQGLTAFGINLGRGNIEGAHDLPKGQDYRDIFEYVQINGVDIVYNTFVNNHLNFMLSGGDRTPLEPENTIISNNLIVSEGGHVLSLALPETLEHPGIDWQGNMIYAPTGAFVGLDAIADERAFVAVNPELTSNLDQVMYIGKKSPVIDAAIGTFPYVTTDIEGKPRDENPDVGAFEYRGYPLLRGPLAAEDVGPFAKTELTELSLVSPSVFITDIRLEATDGTISASSSGWSGEVGVEIDGVVIGDMTDDVSLVVRVGDGEEVYRDLGFPARFVLQTAKLDEGVHELVVIAQRGHQQSERKVSFLVQNVVVQSPGVDESVHGIWPVTLDVRLPDDVIQKARIVVGDLLIFEGPHIPKDVTFDSMLLEEGGHTLRVEIERKGGGESGVTTDFRVNNIWEVSDALKPPVNFFGQWIDQSATIDASDGWEHATDRAAEFFGDADRLVSEKETMQHLAWETPRLTRAIVTIYSRDEDVARESLQFAVSADGEEYSNIEYEVKVLERSEVGWHKLALVADTKGDHLTNYFRLTVQSQAASSMDLQIGHVRLIGLN